MLYPAGYGFIMSGPLRTLVASLLMLLWGAALAGCNHAEAPATGPTVLAASSLQEALEAAAEAWAAKGHPRPVLSFAATSALARQIESGAPADLFVAADEQWMDTLEQVGAVRTGTRALLLGNAIVVIAPVRSGLRARALDSAMLARALGDSGRLAIADPDGVPAGRYARAALESLGLWTVAAPRLARAENARAALALVERGEAPLGIVYATDAQASDGVRIVAGLPATSHPPIRYPIAALTSSAHPDAETFRQFLLSDEARGIFGRFGFLPIR